MKKIESADEQLSYQERREAHNQNLQRGIWRTKFLMGLALLVGLVSVIKLVDPRAIPSSLVIVPVSLLVFLTLLNQIRHRQHARQTRRLIEEGKRKRR